jgi:protein SCO1/2
VSVGLAALAGCGQPQRPQQRQVFEVKGVVKEVMPDRPRVKIHHETITNYMAAMTMEFEVKTTNDLVGLQPGDAVTFRMVVTEDDGWIENVRKVASAPATVTLGTNEFRRVRDVEPLNEGDPLPEYQFTNEFGRVVRLGEYQGQALALTFIFTRCPFPTYCPRMSGHFAKVRESLAARPGGPTNWHLLSITIDPQFDTPTILQSYGKRYGYDPKRWNLLTGDLVDITAIAEQFGLTFWRPDPNLPAGINHNLRTAIIDARGRVQKVFPGDAWKPEEVVEEMVKAAEAKP